MIRFVILLSLVLTTLAGGAGARAAEPVDVTIEVLEASRSAEGFSGSARRYARNLSDMGFSGARTVDTVTARDRSEGSSVELRFGDASGKKRAIRVTVLESAKARTKLRVEVPSLEFGTTTTHKKGGTFLVVIRKTGLVLAVRPSH